MIPVHNKMCAMVFYSISLSSKIPIMKSLLIILLGATISLFGAQASAQSMTPAHDTIWTTAPSGSITITNNIAITTTTPFTIDWKVVETNFPADWQSIFQACDNNSCYPLPTLLPISAGRTKTSAEYFNGPGAFSIGADFASVTSYGTYYVRFKFMSNATTDTTVETFIFNRTTTGVSSLIKSTDDVVIYPNPANNELNVVYDANADVKNIAVYNIIGKVMTVYKVTGESANLNLEAIPSGIYFVRLLNSHGAVVATRKFTKQ